MGKRTAAEKQAIADEIMSQLVSLVQEARDWSIGDQELPLGGQSKPDLLFVYARDGEDEEQVFFKLVPVVVDKG